MQERDLLFHQKWKRTKNVSRVWVIASWMNEAKKMKPPEKNERNGKRVKEKKRGWSIAKVSCCVLQTKSLKILTSQWSLINEYLKIFEILCSRFFDWKIGREKCCERSDYLMKWRRKREFMNCYNIFNDDLMVGIIILQVIIDYKIYFKKFNNYV